MGSALEITGLLLLSSTKFLFAPGTVIASGYSFWETVFITTIGGWVGVFIYFYFGRVLIELFFRRYFTRRRRKRPKKKFTRMNKLIIKSKSRYGLVGLAIITPTIISIPLGCILAARYFGYDRRVIPYLLLSVLCWSLSVSAFSSGISKLF